MDIRFKDPKASKLINPVEWFSEFGNPSEIFIADEGVIFTEETKEGIIYENSFLLQSDGCFKIIGNNKFDFVKGLVLTKFQLLCAIRFKDNFYSACEFILTKNMGKQLPYVRVSSDYFKIIRKRDRFGGVNISLKPWKKEEIRQDSNKEIFASIPKYDDFIIEPNNLDHCISLDNCFNLYSKFSHTPSTSTVSLKEIPTTEMLMNHIFGDQVELGYKYMKLLYQFPKQILPVLSLVSEERETGKTTFLNWIKMIFGDNSVAINPSDLTSDFNSGYATKNIIMLDETVIEKNHIVEKLKALATAKTISINTKNVQQYSVPFFGKMIISTNKEKDFMRIDSQEIRFWVRKINTIPSSNKNTNIENDLFKEISLFLKYLIQLPDIDFSKSRMVFTKEEISNKFLQAVKEESKTGLHKELEILIFDFFNANPECKEFHATATDIKREWFLINSQINRAYIFKVLSDEMKLDRIEKNSKYHPFDKSDQSTGIPFIFKRPESATVEKKESPHGFTQQPIFEQNDQYPF